LTPMLRSSPLTDWFSDAQRVQGMLDFEAALAQAQAVCGMVPPEAVGPIVAACRHETIDFAALGSIAKSGKSAIAEVLSPGQRPTKRGLIYAATPASDFVCGTQQVASGITVQVFTTGRGTPYGLVAVPVIKMATRTELANRWYDLMDINAGTIATGEETIEEVGLKLFEFILDVASGRKKTFSDQWGLHNQLAVFNPAPVT